MEWVGIPRRTYPPHPPTPAPACAMRLPSLRKVVVFKLCEIVLSWPHVHRCGLSTQPCVEGDVPPSLRPLETVWHDNHGLPSTRTLRGQGPENEGLLVVGRLRHSRGLRRPNHQWKAGCSTSARLGVSEGSDHSRRVHLPHLRQPVVRTSRPSLRGRSWHEHARHGAARPSPIRNTTIDPYHCSLDSQTPGGGAHGYILGRGIRDPLDPRLRHLQSEAMAVRRVERLFA